MAFDKANHANRDGAVRSGMLVLSGLLFGLILPLELRSEPVASVVTEAGTADAATVAAPAEAVTAPGTPGGGRPTPTECVYSTSVWHVEKKTVVDRRTVRKPYSALDPDERDPNDPRCTVCEADQVRINPALLGLSGLPAFRVCHAYVEQVKEALRTLAKDPDVRIVSITGYRPGRIWALVSMYQRSGSAPCLSIIRKGSTALPRRFDILLPFLSSTNPLDMMFLNETESEIIVAMACSVKNHPRVWSTPSAMKSAGNISSKFSLFSKG